MSRVAQGEGLPNVFPRSVGVIVEVFADLGDQEKKEVHFSETAKDGVSGKKNDEESSKQQTSNDKDDVKDSNNKSEKGTEADKEENSSVSTSSPKRKTTKQVGKVKGEPKKKIDKRPRAEDQVEVFIDDLQALPHVLRMDSDNEGRLIPLGYVALIQLGYHVCPKLLLLSYFYI